MNFLNRGLDAFVRRFTKNTKGKRKRKVRLLAAFIYTLLSGLVLMVIFLLLRGSTSGEWGNKPVEGAIAGSESRIDTTDRHHPGPVDLELKELQVLLEDLAKKKVSIDSASKKMAIAQKEVFVFVEDREGPSRSGTLFLDEVAFLAKAPRVDSIVEDIKVKEIYVSYDK